MNESLLTNESENNVTKETEASLSYEEYESSKVPDIKDHIISAISLNLTEIIKDNTGLKDFVSKDMFYLPILPPISLYDYINRLVKYNQMEISTLINAIIYIDTFCEKNKYVLCMNNVYLLLLSACLISLKFNEDKPINLKTYAQIAGISFEIVKHLEYSLCLFLQYDFYVKEDLYQSYYDYFTNYEVPYPKQGKEI